MKKISKNKKMLIVLAFVVLLLTGCTTPLKDSNKKIVTNPETGQSLTENIFCRPKDEDVIKIYEENGVDINSLPSCTSFSLTKVNYDGFWSTIFVRTLAWAILKIGTYVKSYGLSLIIVSLIIRLIAFPITQKTAMQSEVLKEAQPELDRLEKKYKDKKDQDSMMKKSQEMAMIYKKYKINPVAGCLFAIIQLPIFIAFLEAINRVPAIFEEKFLLWQLGTTPYVGVSGGIKAALCYALLTVLVGLTTYFSLKLNSSSNPGNDQAAQMTKIMFFMILFMSVFMTSALNIYWIVSNLFTIVQNILVKKRKEKRKKV